MATLKKVSAEEIRQARKGGYKGKAPKKPKNKTVTTLESYISRYNDWVDRVKAASKDFKKLESLKKQIK